jgi:hypothetical protein
MMNITTPLLCLKTKRKLTGLNQNNLNYFDFRKAGHQKFD